MILLTVKADEFRPLLLFHIYNFFLSLNAQSLFKIKLNGMVTISLMIGAIIVGMPNISTIKLTSPNERMKLTPYDVNTFKNAFVVFVSCLSLKTYLLFQ